MAVRRASRRSLNIWPGFVDALTNLLLVVMFVLVVFMVAQFFLSVAISGKDEALLRLESEINELAELLALERGANTELRLNVEQLSAELQSSLASRESLTSQLAALSEERASLASQLAAVADERDRLAALADEERSERERMGRLLGSSEESLAETRAELQRSQQALADRQTELDAARNQLNAALARIEIEQKKLEEALAAVAAGKAELEDAYGTIEADKEKIEAQLAELAILKSLRDDLVKRLEESEGALAEERELTDEAQLQVTLLNRQLAALREQLARISEALEIAEAENEAQQVQIADLGKRLNVALATKVQELARYRSEFFGRLREILGSREDIRIVGDRFVFQSEILFASGAATIEPNGRPQLARLASTLKEISADIPDDIDWVLRVDGHTDRKPISTFAFPSNWELSTARAVSVVKFLIEQGIPPERLAATGFGEFQPLDGGSDEIAYRRNRRIEFKLTER